MGKNFGHVGIRYAVSTVDFDEQEIRKYIRHQEQLDSKGYDSDEKDNDDNKGKDDGNL